MCQSRPSKSQGIGVTGQRSCSPRAILVCHCRSTSPNVTRLQLATLGQPLSASHTTCCYRTWLHRRSQTFQSRHTEVLQDPEWWGAEAPDHDVAPAVTAVPPTNTTTRADLRLILTFTNYLKVWVPVMCRAGPEGPVQGRVRLGVGLVHIARCAACGVQAAARTSASGHLPDTALYCVFRLPWPAALSSPPSHPLLSGPQAGLLGTVLCRAAAVSGRGAHMRRHSRTPRRGQRGGSGQGAGITKHPGLVWTHSACRC